MFAKEACMYKKRALEKTIDSAAKGYAAITIYGARQTGKSTFVYSHFGPSFPIVTLDDLDELALAKSNPKLFLEAHPWPVAIDEIQKAPSLLPLIKEAIDEEKRKWLFEEKEPRLMYILTGSSQIELRQAVSDSLAGRTAIFNMASFSLDEIDGNDRGPFIPEVKAITEASSKGFRYRTRAELFEEIFKGGMPEYRASELDRDTFFHSYVLTYLEKDVGALVPTEMLHTFRLFLEYIALRTGQQIVYEDVAGGVGIDARTVKRWLSVLESTNIVYFLRPYASSLSDRVTKNPKLYFLDTGLAAYLCRWPSASMLEKSPMAGAFFETFVISEIVKTHLGAGRVLEELPFYYYRDKDQKEADFIYETTDGIIPVEIKKGINPVSSSFNFDYLRKYKKPVKKGLVIACRDTVLPINKDVWYCPVALI